MKDPRIQALDLQVESIFIATCKLNSTLSLSVADSSPGCPAIGCEKR